MPRVARTWGKCHVRGDVVSIGIRMLQGIDDGGNGVILGRVALSGV